MPCIQTQVHNFRLGRQRRKVRQIHARSKVTLLNCELLNHGRMSRWRQRVLPPKAYGFNKCQLPSFFEGSNMMHSYLWGASNNHHWFRWDELFWIGKTHHICLLSREREKHSTLLKILQKMWYFLASYFDQWHLHDIMLFFMYCLLTQAIMEPKHDPAHLIRALFDRAFYYSPSFQKEILHFHTSSYDQHSCWVSNISHTLPFLL